MYVSEQLSEAFICLPSQRNPSETSSYKLLFRLVVTISQPLGTCLRYLFFKYHEEYFISMLFTWIRNTNILFKPTQPILKFFSSGFTSANLKARYKQVILAIPGRKISVPSAKPRGWLAPIAQVVTLPQQLCLPFKSKGTVWTKWGAPGAMNPLIAQRETFQHKCFTCY